MIRDLVSRRATKASKENRLAASGTQQDDPCRPASITPAKAGAKTARTVSAAVDARFRGNDEEVRECRGLEAYHFYGRPAERIVLFDSERGKGDHRHIGELKAPTASRPQRI
jgi:hypothetical protein